MHLLRFGLVALSLSTAACGANVVFGEDGGDQGGGGSGDGGSSSTTSPTTNNTTVTTDTTSTGTTSCSSHDQCPGGLCRFVTGECIQACTIEGTCEPGFVCDPCATSSCPGCADCGAGCVPIQPVGCDDHADCGMSAGQDVCIFSQGVCAQRCGAGSPPCPPELICNDCATSSCPGCRDCVGACMVALP